MKARKITLSILAIFSMLLIAGSCSPDKNGTNTDNAPSVGVEISKLESHSVTISVSTKLADSGAWLIVENGTALPSVESVLSEGEAFDVSSDITLSSNSLMPETNYTAVVAATNAYGSDMATVEFTTTAAEYCDNHALIVFMQGDNGLADFMDINLQNIIAEYYNLPEGAQVVIFYDRGNYTRLTELYLSDGIVKQRLIKDYNRTLSSVDPEFMKGVFDLIKQEIVADSYGIILSSHGGGWVPGEIYTHYLRYDWNALESGEPSARPYFYGQDGSDYLEVPVLAEILADFHFEYIIFDACFMSSVEALYDLRNNSDYIIASSAEVLGNGFPYSAILSKLFLKGHGLQSACEAYMDLFRDSSGTISLIDCSELDNLATAMANVVAASDKDIDPTQIQGYESYPIHLYYDLEQHIEQMTDDEALRTAFRTALDKAVVFTDHTPTFFSGLRGEHTMDLPRSCGLTCHVEREEFPETHAAYLETAWAKAIGAK